MRVTRCVLTSEPHSSEPPCLLCAVSCKLCVGGGWLGRWVAAWVGDTPAPATDCHPQALNEWCSAVERRRRRLKGSWHCAVPLTIFDSQGTPIHRVHPAGLPSDQTSTQTVPHGADWLSHDTHPCLCHQGLRPQQSFQFSSLTFFVATAGEESPGACMYLTAYCLHPSNLSQSIQIVWRRY